MMTEFQDSKKRKREAEGNDRHNVPKSPKRTAMDPQMKEVFFTQSGMSESHVEEIIDMYNLK